MAEAETPELAKPVSAKSFTVAEDGSRIVRLKQGFTGHNGHVDELRLREPTFKDFIELGDPTALICSSNSLLPMDDLLVIRGYIERLSGVDPILLQKLCLADAIALRDAVKDFFRAASANTSAN